MRIGIVSVLAVGLVSAPLSAQPQDAAVRSENIFADIGPVEPGCAAGAIQGGKVMFAKAYGLADLEHKVPLTIRSPVYLASVSKQFTAFVILALEKDGKLTRTDSVRKYVPELGGYANAITIEHLLTHTSGLRDYDALGDLVGNPEEFVATEADFLKVMGQQRSGDFPPGTQFAYSNAGYTMLSLIVQRVTGRTMDAVAREKIFAPLGMTNTRFQSDHRGLVPGKAVGYSRKSDIWRTTNVLFDTVGAGGMYSTIEDMLLWAGNFKTPKVGAEALAAMPVSAVLNDGKKTGYGMGLAPGDYRGLKIVQHNGGVQGYRTTFIYFPNEDFGVTVLCNRGDASPEGLVRRLADVWLDGRFTSASVAQQARAQVKVAPDILRRYTGDYRLDDGFAVSITLEKDQLLAHMTGGHSLWLMPSSQNSFFTGLPISFTFDTPGKDGVSPRMVMDENGPLRSMQRLILPPLTGQEAANYGGRYRNDEMGVEVTVAMRDGKLLVTGKTEQTWLRVGPDAFSGGHPFGPVAFRRDGGRITGFVANGAIKNLRFDKLP